MVDGIKGVQTKSYFRDHRRSYPGIETYLDQGPQR
jgi:hypothetical protein